MQDRPDSRAAILAGVLAFAIALLSGTDALAQCSEGTRGSNGLVPVLSLGSPVAGESVRVTVRNVSPGATNVFVGFSDAVANRDVASVLGAGAVLWPELEANPAPGFPFRPARSIGVTPGTHTVSLRMPLRWAGRLVNVQAFVQDPGAEGGLGFALTGGQRVMVRSRGEILPIDSVETTSLFELPRALVSPDVVADPETGKAWVIADEILEFDFGVPATSGLRSSAERPLPALLDFAACWDDSRGVAWLFGGRDRDTGLFSEGVRVFDPSRPEGDRLSFVADRLPEARGGGSAVFDSRRGVVTIFGGMRSNGQAVATILEFDPSRPFGDRFAFVDDVLPRASNVVSASYDERRGVTYLAGDGSSAVLKYDPALIQGSRLSQFDAMTVALSGTSLVIDPILDRLYIAGGRTAHSTVGTLIEMNPAAPTGARIRELERLPRPVAYSAAFFSTALRKCVLVGGFEVYGWTRRITEFASSIDPRPLGGFGEDMSGGNAFIDPATGTAYVFGSAIYEVNPGAVGEPIRETADVVGPNRNLSSVAWDSGRRVAYVFGGYESDSQTHVDEVFTFDPSAEEGSRLVRLPDSLPSGLGDASAVFDPRRRVVYLFGGLERSCWSADAIHEFDPEKPVGARFTVLPDRLASPSSSITGVWDDRTEQVFLLGDGTSWIYSFDSRRPPGTRLMVAGQLEVFRLGGSMTYDTTLGLLIAGGGRYGGRSLKDLFAIDTTAPGALAIVELNPLVSGRAYAPAVYDAKLGVSLLLGGFESGGGVEIVRPIR